MTYLIRESNRLPRQVYTISIFTDGSTRHSPIYSDDSTLMLMAIMFTNLVELVKYFSRKPIFKNQSLKKSAPRYLEFRERQLEQRPFEVTNRDISFKPLSPQISLKIDALTIRKLPF